MKDFFHRDGLVVCARGLGIARLLLRFLRPYSEPASLVLNVSSAENVRGGGRRRLPAGCCRLRDGVWRLGLFQGRLAGSEGPLSLLGP